MAKAKRNKCKNGSAPSPLSQQVILIINQTTIRFPEILFLLLIITKQINDWTCLYLCLVVLASSPNYILYILDHIFRLPTRLKKHLKNNGFRLQSRRLIKRLD
jgi:hypothetical protein